MSHEVEGKVVESALALRLSMINNQFSRRNLSVETRLALAYKFKEFEAEKAKARQGTRNDLPEEDNISLDLTESEEDANFYQLVGRSDNDQKIQSRGSLGEIAKRDGVSHTTAE